MYIPHKSRQAAPHTLLGQRYVNDHTRLGLWARLLGQVHGRALSQLDTVVGSFGIGVLWLEIDDASILLAHLLLSLSLHLRTTSTTSTRI